MKDKLMELKIPCGWEIIINEFYECECSIPQSNYKDENSKILLHLERDVPVDRGDHFIIILEWIADEKEKYRYRITAEVQAGEGKKHLNKFETSDCNFIKEVFNRWINELSQFLVDAKEAALHLGYIVYSEFYNKDEDYPLMKLMIPSGWNIISNCFYDLDCTQENLERRLFSADMLFIETSGNNTDKGKYIISLDWVPYNDPKGKYMLQVAFVDFNEVIMKFKSRNRNLIKDKIFHLMNIIESCKNKSEVIEEFNRK